MIVSVAAKAHSTRFIYSSLLVSSPQSHTSRAIDRAWLGDPVPVLSFGRYLGSRIFAVLDLFCANRLIDQLAINMPHEEAHADGELHKTGLPFLENKRDFAIDFGTCHDLVA